MAGDMLVFNKQLEVSKVYWIVYYLISVKIKCSRTTNFNLVALKLEAGGPTFRSWDR
jgi:hypothetical protein